MEGCRARFSFILAALIETAQQISKAEFDDPEKNKELPFRFVWWVFFVKMSLEKVLDMMMASLSNTAKVILGGDMGSEELLLLPSKWEGCKLWGVYTDIFKKDTLVPVNPSRGGRTDFGGVVTFDRDETVDEAARYCGSGTDRKNGVAARMNVYPAMRNGTRKAEPGAHADFLKRKDPNLRLIASFDPSATAKPHVLLMEQLLSILLQTLNIGTTKKCMRASTIAMIRRATPRDLPQPEYERLNNAAQCLQGLFYTRHGGSVCANENCGTTETDSWCSADPGVPFSRVICSTCYYCRRRHNGEERPAKLAAKPKRVRRDDLAKQAGPKPTGKHPCPGCGRTDVTERSWKLPKGDLYQPGRTAWECSTCWSKPASALPVNGGKKIVRRNELGAEIGPQPPAGAPCGGYGRPSNQWHIPKGDLVLEPGRKRYECKKLLPQNNV